MRSAAAIGTVPGPCATNAEFAKFTASALDLTAASLVVPKFSRAENDVRDSAAIMLCHSQPGKLQNRIRSSFMTGRFVHQCHGLRLPDG